MEAEDGFSIEKESSRPGCKIVHWQNDWNKFKRVFKVTGQLNGIADALRYGEMVANGANTENIKVEDYRLGKLKTRAVERSPKLAALLTLAIANSVGAQQSIVMNELENDEDGVMAWAKLIKHFERSTQDIRIEYLLHQWENEALKPVGSLPYSLLLPYLCLSISV